MVGEARDDDAVDAPRRGVLEVGLEARHGGEQLVVDALDGARARLRLRRFNLHGVGDGAARRDARDLLREG